MENKDNNKLSCTFCGKGQEEVRKLIAGPSVYICDECVDLCNDIIEEEVKAEDEEVLDVRRFAMTREDTVSCQRVGRGPGVFDALRDGEHEVFVHGDFAAET